MAATEAPPRHRRAFWADLRFVLGIVLVVASVVGVWFVVAAARQTVPVFAAARNLVPGETVDSDSVRVVEVALGALDAAYAGPGTLRPGSIATRTVDAGELVPLSAIGAADAGAVTTVVLRSATDVPASVDSGSEVEVWVAPMLERGVFDQPRILVPDATVASVTREDSVLGAGSASLELVIARADVAATLAAISGGGALSVVPVWSEKR